jgi:hypothetical protein
MYVYRISLSPFGKIIEFIIFLLKKRNKMANSEPASFMNKIIFTDQDSFKMNSDASVDSSSSLLIPDILFDEFKSRAKKYNGVPTYFKAVLRKFRIFTHAGLIPAPSKLKTEFQKEGQNLKRVNFVPNNADWLEIGCIALSYGKSRTWVFTYLLYLDILGVGKLIQKAGFSRGVPVSPSYQLQGTIQLQRVLGNWTRSYHVKV